MQSGRVPGRPKRGVLRRTSPQERKLRLLTHMRRPLKERVPNSNHDGRFEYRDTKPKG